MTGIIALQGGGPFTANDDLDARLLARTGGEGRVVVLPTADAFEHPERLVVSAMNWGERLGVEIEALMVMRRAEAQEEGVADVVRAARAVYLVGDQPLHLRSVLKDTPLWRAIVEHVAGDGLVVGVGGSASALCDPMVDPRGGAFTLGLGLLGGLAVVSEADTWSRERLSRTLQMADTPVAVVPTGAALVRSAAAGAGETGWSWELVGEVDIRHGELPA